MKLLPIAERELRVASRRRGTYWVRFGAVALALGTASIIFLAMMRERPSEQAQVLFFTLAGIAFGYCLLSGALTTSDCLSEEKREGTLGLLFLTDLRGYDVVAGKLVASSVRAVSALVAMLPVLAIPLLMGSIAGKSVGQVAMVLGNTLFLSLAVGVLVSTFSRDSRHAVGGTISAMVTLIAVVPLLRWLWLEYVVRHVTVPPPPGSGPAAEPLAWLLLANPVVSFALAMEGVFRAATPRPEFQTGLLIQHVLAWAALVAACVALPHRWRDRADSARSGKAARTTSEPAARQARAELLEVQPFAWIIGRERRPILVTWAGLVVIALVWCWGFFEVREEWLQGFIGLWTLFFGALWLKFRLAGVACRHLHEHRRTGALELVLCTAQTPASIVSGCLAGLRRVIFPALATVLATGGLLMVAGVGQDRGGGESGELLAIFVVGAGMLLLDLWTLSWVGLWQGLQSQRYVRAYGVTVGSVLLLPWVLFVVSAVLAAVGVEVLQIGPSIDPQFGTIVGWWTLLSVAVDAWLLTSCRRRLLERFRDLAVGHFGPLRGGDSAAATTGAPAPADGSGKPS